jgi:hypothetical protein
MTLVSSANIMGFAKVFIVGGRSFMYIMKSKGPRIDPWEHKNDHIQFYLITER